MSEIVYVRLTSIEFDLVSKLKVGEIFTHANLHHHNTGLREDAFKEHLAVRIVKSGAIVKDRFVDPELDLSRKIKIKLINTITDLDLYSNTPHQNIILHNPIGLFESIRDRYLHVLKIGEEELRDMKYYIREFTVL